MKISKKNIRFLGPRTDAQTDRVTTEGTLSACHDFFLQPIIKARSNNFLQLPRLILSYIDISGMTHSALYHHGSEPRVRCVL